MRFFIILTVLCFNFANANDPEWFSNFVDIRSKLIDGHHVRVNDALPEDLLQFDFENISWTEKQVDDVYGKPWLRRQDCDECAQEIQKWIMEHKYFFQLLIPHKNISRVAISLTKYEKEDFLDFHNDYGNRLLSFILHLNSARSRCGGDLIWAGDRGIKKIKPFFNSLNMFIPSIHSYHMIEKIYCGKRYAVSGWFY